MNIVTAGYFLSAALYFATLMMVVTGWAEPSRSLTAIGFLGATFSTVNVAFSQRPRRVR